MQHRVAITIWRLATNVDYRTISHLFDVGVSTVGSIVRDCCHVIHEQLAPKYVRIPIGGEFDRMIEGFETRWVFLTALVRLMALIYPSLHPLPTIVTISTGIMQDVVDMNISWPGSVHDAHVLANSILYQLVEEGRCFPLKERNVGGIETLIVTGTQSWQWWPSVSSSTTYAS